jgi:phage/plasmid-associated DNA primase
VVSSEEVTDEVIDADMIKTIVGGDPISVNRKHRPRIDLRKNVLKVIVFANRVPQFSQVDQGFLERVRIIRTRNPLEEEEREPIRDEYLEKMKKEVIEFLLWCSFRLKEKGDIIEDMDPVEKFRMITRMSNPLRPFIDTALIVDREAEEKGTDLYEAYLEWASRRAVKVLGRDKFYEYLQREFPAIQRHHALWFLGCRIRRF